MEFDKHRLIGKYLSGNASPEEKKLVDDWAQKTPENGRELAEIQKLWSVSLNLKKEKKDDLEMAWETFQKMARSEPKIRRLEVHSMKIAAAIVLSLFTAFLIGFFLKGPKPEVMVAHQSQAVQASDITSKAPHHDTVVTKSPVKKPAHSHTKLLSSFTWIAGDTVNVCVLPDGSKVQLNKYSRITYTRSGRTVSLEGEAFFEVKPDSIPFFVACKNTLTRVLGTSFNIKGSAQGETVEVTVVTGLVEVSDKLSDSNKIELKAGDVVTYNYDRAFVKSSANKKAKWWNMSSIRDKIKHFFKKIRHKNN